MIIKERITPRNVVCGDRMKTMFFFFFLCLFENKKKKVVFFFLNSELKVQRIFSAPSIQNFLLCFFFVIFFFVLFFFSSFFFLMIKN